MLVKKRDIKYYVDGEYSKKWFDENITNGDWEEETFDILDKYGGKGVYIDVGAWIGPTVLYAANIYDKVICLEPDPVAIQRLEKNMATNKYNNITLIKKALSYNGDKIELSSNIGTFGESVSTILISDRRYADEQWGLLYGWEQRTKNIIEVDTITMEDVLKNNKISIKDVRLIKIDIEGGELFVLPSMLPFLKKHKPVLYISVHRWFLKEEQVDTVIKMLYSVYDVCYSAKDLNTKLNMKQVIDSDLEELLFI